MSPLQQNGCTGQTSNIISRVFLHFQSWIFSIITPVYSVTWSFEIIRMCWFGAFLINVDAD